MLIHTNHGPCSPYCAAGASALLSMDDGERRRALRSYRRWVGGPMRIRVRASAYRHSGMYDADECEVYGWRAALTAARAMRSELGGDRDDPARRRVTVDAIDPRWVDAVERGNSEGWW